MQGYGCSHLKLRALELCAVSTIGSLFEVALITRGSHQPLSSISFISALCCYLESWQPFHSIAFKRFSIKRGSEEQCPILTLGMLLTVDVLLVVIAQVMTVAGMAITVRVVTMAVIVAVTTALERHCGMKAAK